MASPPMTLRPTCMEAILTSFSPSRVPTRPIMPGLSLWEIRIRCPSGDIDREFIQTDNPFAVTKQECACDNSLQTVLRFERNGNEVGEVFGFGVWETTT